MQNSFILAAGYAFLLMLGENFALSPSKFRILTQAPTSKEPYYQESGEINSDESTTDYQYMSEKSSKILTGPSRPRPPYEVPNQTRPMRPRPPYGIPNKGYGDSELISQGSGNTQAVQNHPSISPIDMQLLSAMEKIVGRMDALDNRVKTLETIVHFLTEKEKPEKHSEAHIRGNCPENFEKVEGIRGKCYYFSNSEKPPRIADWKVAAGHCSKLGGRLAELLNFSEYVRLTSHLVKYTNPRNAATTDYWTSGLNPGLIWIWSESGIQIDLDKRFWNENDNTSNAPGCLKLSYSFRLSSFFFKSAPCSQGQNFVCEVLDNSVSRALATYEKNLFSDESEESEEDE